VEVISDGLALLSRVAEVGASIILLGRKGFVNPMNYQNYRWITHGAQH